MIRLPDVTTIYVVISFAIAYAILKRYLFVPLGKILDEREHDAAEAEALLAEARKRLQKAVAEAEERLALARREALKMREELRAEGRKRLDARLAEAGAAAAASIESASRRIELMSGEFAGLLPETAQGLARTLAEKILGRTLAA
jgi:F-type H+-transporting ATPase subunit b